MNFRAAASAVLGREAVRALDQRTIAAGTPARVLMESAGQALADFVQDSGATGIACTLFDVLSGLDEVRICVRYRLPDGTETDRFIPDAHRLEGVTPVYETLPGWQCSTADCRSLDDLPATARSYLRFLADLMGVPIAIVSLGAQRDQTIVVEDPIHGPKRALLSA